MNYVLSAINIYVRVMLVLVASISLIFLAPAALLNYITQD